ncbi:hypothetical protein CVU82_03925 [Candidatus Falkowbacteria bacterium HGW-Falkowbacteria-1]|uniref:DNA translocase FtsK 4TM region domain-containing protein n=1 Tax=Candidatus Falkowbacteria bacterium HGW-Falkowbacteria-1 TaxID=2013768 RepID=A0A2N2E8W3_9BACT|nr:MAG: hypothetical protein CVU82_03925 [Candidatus Falkowbacteria bacterium HGW-Falkowbacteria-1]
MKIKLFLLLSLFSIFFCFSFVSAKSIDYGLNVTSKQGKLEQAFRPVGSDAGGYLVDKLGGVTGVLLSFVGLLFLILMIYGGLLWMTASGNDQQVVKSRNVMVWAAVGIVIVFISFILVQFIGAQLTKPTFDSTSPPGEVPEGSLEEILPSEEGLPPEEEFLTPEQLQCPVCFSDNSFDFDLYSSPACRCCRLGPVSGDCQD